MGGAGAEALLGTPALSERPPGTWGAALGGQIVSNLPSDSLSRVCPGKCRWRATLPKGAVINHRWQALLGPSGLCSTWPAAGEDGWVFVQEDLGFFSLPVLFLLCVCSRF